jgi:hypothetical protein
VATMSMAMPTNLSSWKEVVSIEPLFLQVRCQAIHTILSEALVLYVNILDENDLLLFHRVSQA